MSVLTIAWTNAKTSRLNNPAYVKNRIKRKLRDSFFFLLAKWFFHFVSIFSTSMMLSASLVSWVKVPLSNMGIDLLSYGDALFLPTVVTSVLMSLTLEITTTEIMAGTIEAIRKGVGLFEVSIRLLAMSILIATQLYTFVEGAKNTLIYALVPDTYEEQIKSSKARVAYYKELENIVSKKITAVKNGTGKTDDLYGSGTSSFLKRFESDLKNAKKAHEVFMAREMKKKINLGSDGKFTRVAKALVDKRYMELVKPIEDSYNKAKSSKLDKKKMWLMSAKNDLLEQRTFKQKYLDEAKASAETYKAKIQEVASSIDNKYYWYIAIMLMLALSAMGYSHSKTLEDALRSFDNAKNSNKNKEDSFDVSRYEEDIKEDPGIASKEVSQSAFKPRSMDDVYNIADDKFLQFIADTYQETGKIPNSPTISAALDISVGTLTNKFARNSHYFVRQNGRATQPTEEFLADYNLGILVDA